MSAPLQSSTSANAAEQQPQGPAPTHKSFLAKKMGGASFCSPTDNMMSPCSQKLVQSKKRHYTKGKPLSLSASLVAAAAARGPGGSALAKSSTTADAENEQPVQMES